MPPSDDTTATELEGEATVLYRVIGSAAFKWAMGVIGAVVIALLALGWTAYLEGAASKNPDVVSAKASVDTLTVAVAKLKETADSHTNQLSIAATTAANNAILAASDRAHAAEVQDRIFGAIKKLSDDVHTIDVAVGRVDQKVDDLKDQRK